MPTPVAAPLRHAPMPSQTDNMRGIILMALGFFSFAACDVQAKFLTDALHPVQIVWFRQIGLALGILVILAIRGTQILRSHLPLLQIARGVTAVCSAICFIIAVTYVPLADVVAVTFIAPFLVTIMGATILREPVGIRRWIAVIIGFVGMLIVIRPGMGVLHPAIGFAVVAATFFAVRQVLSRSLSGADPILTTVAYTSLTSIALVSVALPFVWVTPTDPTLWMVIVGLAVTAGLGEVLVIRALDIAQAVVVAPLHYSLIIWGTFYGYVVFADLPDGWTLFGCSIIIASGLFTLYRERMAAKSRGPDA
ncbi:DMT family transporter [Antarctobacter jejuensis]|uniref:DMT family transporter n=1 Tax=Antarctobacter jejuensis TaxID=1439938 RepID=UPI003FD0C711